MPRNFWAGPEKLRVARNYFPKPGYFQKCQIFLFLWVFSQFSNKYMNQKSAIFHPKLDFMMSRTKIAAARKNIFGKVVNLNKGTKF